MDDNMIAVSQDSSVRLVLRDMSDAPTDGTIIWAKFRPNIFTGDSRFLGWNGLWASIRHAGRTKNGFYLSAWRIAGPVGRDNFVSECFDGWIPEPGKDAASAGGDKRLLDALAELESACENLAATRTTRTYHSIVQDGAEELLLVLHQARVKARAAMLIGSPNIVSSDHVDLLRNR